ncbi:MAG TPA: cystathionine gamma-synthase family protein [Ferrovibrio sp.]|uniref:cystathionine gamma-synthase family protein n=1 Tax=Ferrovibrio sp. TaxID=1917215 RepID=UPI002ED43956
MRKQTHKTTRSGHRELHPETQMMSYGYDPFLSEGAVKPPVFLTSTFAFRSAEDGAAFFDTLAGRKPLPPGERAGLIYSRFNHPNLEIVEDRLALLEGAEAAAVFSSGMAAIGAVFLALLRPGDAVVHSSPLYGGTETMLRKILPEFGIPSAEFHDGLDARAIQAAAARAAGRVRLIFIETPANPTDAMVDFAAVMAAADAIEQQSGARPLIVCDNTLLGPIFQKPLRHGVDLTVYSLTKYVGGHSDLVAGSVAGASSVLSRIRTIRSAFGSQLDPHSSWMIARSLETLVLRMSRAAESGRKVARWLAENPHAPVIVHHPDFIADARYAEVYRRQCTGPGSTFAFTLKGAGREQAFKLINALRLFKSAVSLGGTESLICHPASTTHSSVGKEVLDALGVTEGLIRVSIGLEHPDDLIDDLDAAFREALAAS